MIRVIGIDPGTTKIGYGVVDYDEKNKVVILVDYGLVTLKDIFSYKKVQTIYEKMIDLYREYKPDFIAVENQYLGKNVQSLLKLTHAKTAIILAFLNQDREIIIEEYPPTTVKMTITGNGKASKEELEENINRILNTKIDNKHLDISDALGVALCHLNKVHGKFFI